MRKKFIITFIVLIIASVGIGIYLRPYFNEKSKVDISNTSLRIDTEVSLGEFAYTDRSTYEDVFNKNIIARVVFKSRKISKGKVIANLQVKEVYLGEISNCNIQVIENVDYLTEGKETIIVSKGLNIPMQEDKEYIVNIQKAASNLYLFTTLDFSCYLASNNYEFVELDEDFTLITPDYYNKDIILTLSKDFESIFDNGTVDEYIKIRSMAIERARGYILSR